MLQQNVSTAVRSSPVVAVNLNPDQTVTPAPATATSTTSTTAQDAYLSNIINQYVIPESEQKGGVTPAAAGQTILQQLQNSSLFSAQQDTAIVQGWLSANTPAGGYLTDQGGGNTSAEEQSWPEQLERALALVPNTIASPQPVVASSTTSSTMTPLNPPSTVTPAPATSTTTGSTTTPTAATSTTTGTAGFTSLVNALQPLITAATSGSNGGSGSGSSGTSNVSGAGDLYGTSTPISSLGALTPIGTPTTTSSTGDSAPIIVVAVVIVGAVAFWLWERHRKKKQQQGGT